MTVNKTEICARFDEVKWHDSELKDVHLVRSFENPPTRQYELSLDLNLITGYTEGRYEWARYSAHFLGCRILKADFDLLGLIFCGGAISCGVCYPDALELEQKMRGKTQDFDFPEDHHPLEECLGFLLQMIPPGGEILVVAQDFELRKTED